MLCSLETYHVLLDIIWFNYLAMDILVADYRSRASNDAQQPISTHEYLLKEGYSNSLCDKYLAPLLSTLWGTNVGKLLPQFPAEALVRCLRDHKLFRTQRTTPDFRRINAGTSHLIQSMASSFPFEKVHLNTRVREIVRLGKKEYAISTDGGELHFDHIVFAVDNDEVLNILGSNIDAEQKEIIQGLRTTKNIAVLHSDPLVSKNMTLCPIFNPLM
jgi:predicted NAD/FAD-binding protein